jgi:CRP/FNR family transcriptional regulator, cyclic AMP receptor protein
MDIYLLFDYSEFFKGISPANKAALAEICISKTIQKREHLFYEDDRGDAMYILASGSIQVYKSGGDGKESVIKIIQAGEIFAEVILFESDRYPASAVALKKSLIYRIPKRRFLDLLDEKGFRNDFIAMLMKKQRYLAERIHYLTSCDVEERFIRFLEEQYGRKQEYRIIIPKKDIALAIGTTSETFSRLIKRMGKEGILTVNKDVISMKERFWSNRNQE